jgi:hypothetical protein
VSSAGIAALTGLEQQLDLVSGPKNDVDEFVRHRHRPFSDPVEQSFYVMREGGDSVKAKHCAGALDGMERTKDAVDRLVAFRGAGEGERSRFDFGK